MNSAYGYVLLIRDEKEMARDIPVYRLSYATGKISNLISRVRQGEVLVTSFACKQAMECKNTAIEYFKKYQYKAEDTRIRYIGDPMTLALKLYKIANSEPFRYSGEDIYRRKNYKVPIHTDESDSDSHDIAIQEYDSDDNSNQSNHDDSFDLSEDFGLHRRHDRCNNSRIDLVSDSESEADIRQNRRRKRDDSVSEIDEQVLRPKKKRRIIEESDE